MNITDLILRIAATWLLAYSFTSLDGPGAVFARMREWRKGKWHGRHGGDFVIVSFESGTQTTHEVKRDPPRNGLLDCIVCFSAYVGLLVMLAPDGVLLQGFGVAGVAMWAHSYMGWKSYS